MFSVASKLNDKSFDIHLNTISDSTDAVANDTQYHPRCWICAQREAEGEEAHESIQNMDETSRVISDIEIINIVKCELNEPSNIRLNVTKLSIQPAFIFYKKTSIQI